jgi:hypothetical protein
MVKPSKAKNGASDGPGLPFRLFTIGRTRRYWSVAAGTKDGIHSRSCAMKKGRQRGRNNPCDSIDPRGRHRRPVESRPEFCRILNPRPL